MEREGLTVREVSRILEVTPKTVYEWLRGKGPLHPDHVKAQLLKKISEAKQKITQPVEDLQEEIPTILLGLLGSGVGETIARRLTGLPPNYRERYRRRVKEIASWVQREIEEFLNLLEAEFKAKRKKRTLGHS